MADTAMRSAGIAAGAPWSSSVAPRTSGRSLHAAASACALVHDFEKDLARHRLRILELNGADDVGTVAQALGHEVAQVEGGVSQRIVPRQPIPVPALDLEHAVGKRLVLASEGEDLVPSRVEALLDDRRLCGGKGGEAV